MSAPYVPCCCCAGVTPATRRAGAARPPAAHRRAAGPVGVEVTLRTARYPGALRREVVDGVRVSRGGGRYTVYIFAAWPWSPPGSDWVHCAASAPT